jgi:uncharacterized RDD family membrane protein YckC
MHSYGGFWIRVLAYIIDAMILQFASTILAMVGVGVLIAAAGAGDTAIGAAVVLVYGLILPLNWLYFAIMESSVWQGTLGKQALKLVVADESGERIGFGRATGRYFAKILSLLIILVGFFMVGWTQRKQGLHDLIAGTLVCRSDSPDLVTNRAKVFE